MRAMKALLKRTVVFVVTLCLVVSCAWALAPAGSAFAASKKRNVLSRKKVTLTTGKTCKIKVKKPTRKVKWSSSNKKIAYIRKKSGKRRQTVVIKAGKKAGKCWIKAKVGKKVLRCRVIVKKAKTPASTPVIPEEKERQIEIRPLSSYSKDLAAGYQLSVPAGQVNNETFINNTTEVALQLTKRTIALDAAKTGGINNSNTLISPDSVLTAMAMVENGAASETLTEMEEVLSPGMNAESFNAGLSVLNHSLVSAGKPYYSVANSIWAHESEMIVDQAFLQKNKNYHNASFFTAPFDQTTIADINNWVYNNTRNMIDGILESFPDDVRMVLVNAIAFEGKWTAPMTSIGKENFSKADGSVRSVDMLHDLSKYRYLELNGGKGFAKYYRTDSGSQSKIAFVGLLPPAGVSADSYLNGLTGEQFIAAWRASADNTKLVDLKIPKFSYDYKASMKDALKEMGITTAFTDAADFSGIVAPDSPTQYLKIDDVLHKTHIELNEQGTKAAAATAVIMEKSSAVFHQETSIPIHLNRPFVYALVDTSTGIPLFIGVVRTI